MKPKRTREEAGEALRVKMFHYVRDQRQHADEIAAQFKADDPLWPFMPLGGGKQLWTDWVDFARTVVVPYVEADGDEAAVQAFLVEWRKANPHYLAMCIFFGLKAYEQAKSG